MAIGHVSNRGKIVPYSDIKKYINDSDELYRSMFLLEDDALNNFTSVKEYKGKYKLKHIIFDIDIGDDTGDNVINRTYAFIQTLLDLNVEPIHIQVWFSGRGFHIEMPDYFGFEPSKDLPQIVKKTLHNEFSNEIDNIYDKGRIIRVNYTLNKKSGCYKTPISIDEFEDGLDYSDIQMMAKDYLRSDYIPQAFPDKVKPVWSARIALNNQSATTGIQLATPVVSNGNYVPHVVCTQKMNEIANDNKGRRHQLLLRMANAWRRSGISKDGTLALSKLAIPSLQAKETRSIVDSVFGWTHNGYSCNDPVMSEFCDTKCRFFKHKSYGLQVMSTDQLSDKLMNFVMRDHEYSFDLNDLYKLGYSYKFNPGEFVVMIGDVKLGKTAWVQNLVTKVKHLKTLFLSLEVSEHLIYRRFVQVANNVDKHKVMQTWADNTGDKETYENSVRHVNVLSKCDIDGLKDQIQESESKFVVIDTLDGLEVAGYNDPFKKMEKIAIGLKQIAQDLNVIIFGISHISKNAAHNLETVKTLNVHSAKGNSALEQKADKIIAIEGNKDDIRRRVRSLASRDETDFQLSFKFKRDTMIFEQEAF